MVRKLERRSARILAFVLAFIMVASIFAYSIAALFPLNPQQREVRAKYEISDVVARLNASQYVYANFSYIYRLEEDDPLRTYVERNLREVMDPRILNRMVIETNMLELLTAYIGGYPVYFINTGLGKVYFSTQREEKVGNYTLKIYRNVALVDEIEPIAVGFTYPLLEALNRLEGNGSASYMSNLSNFAYAVILNREAAAQVCRQNETTFCDFLFLGYRINGSYYEAVWVMHATASFYFVETNETKEKYDYYYVRTLDDLQVAYIGDRDFDEVLQAKPEIRGIIIQQLS
ncbi:MAG: hypothetical protein ABWW66_04820 [Archaeoglobaceae archaeon]